MPNDPPLSQRPEVGGVRSDRLVLCPADQDESNGNDDFFPCRNELKWLDAAGLPDLSQSSDELPDAVVAVKYARVKGPSGRIPFDRGINQRVDLVIGVLEGLDLPLGVEPPHDLDVLLRDRLLRDPDGFEGGFPGGKEADPNCQAVAHRRKHPHGHLELIDGDAAAAPLASPVVKSNYPVSKVDEPFRIGSEVAECVQHVS